MTPITRDEYRRLMAALYPTSGERAAFWVARTLWRVAERGPIGRLGSWIDEQALQSTRRRAVEGRHHEGKR